MLEMVTELEKLDALFTDYNAGILGLEALYKILLFSKGEERQSYYEQIIENKSALANISEAITGTIQGLIGAENGRKIN